MKTYKAVRGAAISDKDAKVIGRRLEELGEPTPSAIVEDARRPQSPLHRFFEWDAKKAHENYLLDRARYLVRSITVVVTGTQVARAFHSVKVQSFEGGPTERMYVSTEKVALNESLHRQVVKRALEEAEAWQRRYANLESTFREVFKAIEKARKGLTKRRAVKTA